MKYLFPKIVFIVFAFFLFLVGFPETAEASQVEVFDSIAGFETLVKVKNPEGSAYKIQIVSPSGESKEFIFEKRGEFLASEIPASFLKKAGKYSVMVFDSYSGEILEETNFEILSDSPSVVHSGLYPQKSRAYADSKDKILVTLRLQDKYGNPIKGHELSLVSNRKEDEVKPEREQDMFSDENGIVRYWVSSKKTGFVSLTAADRTQGMTFEKRATVVFEEASVLHAVGGDPDFRFLALADSAQAEKAAKKFDVTELPLKAAANENLSFKLRVLDAEGFIVSSYRGAVKFSSTDANAIVPSDYTFQESDMGEHLFELSVSFKTPGKQKLRAIDSNDAAVKGEKEIEVTPARQAAFESAVQITKPTPGKYGVSTLEIEGEAAPNATVNIFDNGQQIGVTRASSTGRFSFATPKLEDGDHVFSAESGGNLSEEIAVAISATESKLEEVKLTPNPAGPGQTVAVEVTSDPDLSNVSVTFAGVVVELAEDSNQPGTYRGEITAPNAPGDYVLDVSLVDALGNEAAYAEAQTLKVDENLRVTGLTFRVPSRVTGVRAFPGDKLIKLTWAPATDDTGIARYKIYYGIDRNNLNQTSNTSDARTAWEVRKLKNGVQYFFQIVGIDTDGNEGHQRSATVGGVPNGEGLESYGYALEGEYVGPPEYLPEDGPETAMLFLFPTLSYVFFRVRKRKIC